METILEEFFKFSRSGELEEETERPTSMVTTRIAKEIPPEKVARGPITIVGSREAGEDKT